MSFAQLFDVLPEQVFVDIFMSFWNFRLAKRVKIAITVALQKDPLNVRALYWTHVLDKVIKRDTNISFLTGLTTNIDHFENSMFQRKFAPKSHAVVYERLRSLAPAFLTTEDWQHPTLIPTLANLPNTYMCLHWTYPKPPKADSLRKWPNVSGLSIVFQPSARTERAKAPMTVGFAFANLKMLEFQFVPTVELENRTYHCGRLGPLKLPHLKHCALRCLHLVDEPRDFRQCPQLQWLLIEHIRWNMTTVPAWFFPASLTKLTLQYQLEWCWEWIPSSVTELEMINSIVAAHVYPQLANIETFRYSMERKIQITNSTWIQEPKSIVEEFQVMLDHMPKVSTLYVHLRFDELREHLNAIRIPCTVRTLHVCSYSEEAIDWWRHHAPHVPVVLASPNGPRYNPRKRFWDCKS